MLSYNKVVGQFGEKLACDYLNKNGYNLIAKNVQIGHLEIDIIVKKIAKLTFVEVKTRTSKTYGEADEMISRQKIKNLKKGIGLYLNTLNKERYNDVSLDFISIDIDKISKCAKIKHYKNIM
ncbi:YraN family protein [Patescibacteria group bacterium]|nr:YraN family protein [Patescibacteria group bacterium]